MRTKRLLVVACLVGTLLGCGQKGPLVLPDAQHPHKKIGIGKPPAAPPSAPTAPTSPAPAPASPAPAPGSATPPNTAPNAAASNGAAH